MVCSGVKEGAFDSQAARIHVLECGDGYSKAYACVLCDGDPACVLSCPRHALSRDPEKMTIRVNQDACDLCGRCLEACPYGAVSLGPGETRVVVCDLCEGLETPQCVAFCPSGALRFGSLIPIPKRVASRQINISLGCNNCGACVPTCSSQILQIRDGWLVPADPSKCQVCEHCATNCPLQAIKINRRSKVLF
jgi:Fe-S-cluster-containing hydrogenase component 2